MFWAWQFLHCPQTIPPGCCMLYPRPQREVWTQPCKNPHFSLLQPIHPAHCTKATVPKESRFLNVLWVARPVSCLMNSSRNPCLSRHHPAFHFSAPAISYFMVMPGLHWRDCLLLQPLLENYQIGIYRFTWFTHLLCLHGNPALKAQCTTLFLRFSMEWRTCHSYWRKFLK